MTMIHLSRVTLHKDWPYRKDAGHLEGLKASMNGPNGQLQPIGVDTSGHLIWGMRRWKAAKEMGWETILARVVDVDDPLTAMKEENEGRLNLAPSELTALMRAIEINEKKKAQERQAHGSTAPGKNASGNISGSVGGDTRDKVAEKFGMSGKTYEAMKTVADNGTPILQQAVDAGEISVSDGAKVAKEPPAVQNKAVKKVRQKKAKTATAAVKEVGPLKDKVGHEVTKACHEAFANLSKWEELDSHIRKLQAGMDELARLPGGEQLVRRLQPTGAEGNTINKSEHLNALKRDLKGTRPYSICPYCEGKGLNKCRGCEGRAWVTKTTWDGAEENVKARLA